MLGTCTFKRYVHILCCGYLYDAYNSMINMCWVLRGRALAGNCLCCVVEQNPHNNTSLKPKSMNEYPWNAGLVHYSGVASYPETSKNKAGHLSGNGNWGWSYVPVWYRLQSRLFTFTFLLLNVFQVRNDEKVLPNCNDFSTNIWSTSHSFGE